MSKKTISQKENRALNKNKRVITRRLVDGRLMKNKILTLRLDENQELYIEKAKSVIEDSRGIGARKVSKTETILVLLSLGMEVFNKKYGNPLKRKD